MGRRNQAAIWTLAPEQKQARIFTRRKAHGAGRKPNSSGVLVLGQEAYWPEDLARVRVRPRGFFFMLHSLVSTSNTSGVS